MNSVSNPTQIKSFNEEQDENKELSEETIQLASDFKEDEKETIKNTQKVKQPLDS